MAYSNTTGYPSVTKVLTPYVDKQWFTPAHCERGTAVHAACEADLNGLFVVPLPLEWQGYYESFLMWKTQAVEEVISTEKRLIDEALGYCGQYDLVFRMKGDNGLTLGDFKTSQAKYPTWPLQLAAYAHLLHKSGVEVSRLVSIRLKKDGSGCLIDEYTNRRTSYFAVFLNILTAYNFFNRR